jgi:hypothetical protein
MVPAFRRQIPVRRRDYLEESSMEASEKPQLPLDGIDQGAVRAIGDRIVIERLEMSDERAARVIRERAEAGQAPGETVTRALEIGARVLDTEETAVNVDYVRAEFERHAGALRERLSKVLEAGDEQLAERIAQSFDGNRDGSVQKEIDKLVGEALEEQRLKIAKLFSAEDGANPLTDFKAAVVRGFKALDERQQNEGEANRKRIEALQRQVIELREREDADERVAAEAERGTAKGFTFEERVHDAIERIASARGDCAAHTGGEGAEGGGKKGDTLVELGAADGPCTGRIVFETKDAERLSKNKAWAYLNEAMERRAASFGVLVVAGEERIPSGREQLTEYEGNKLIVAVDREDPDSLVLEVAYRLAAARVLMVRDRELDVDAVAVRDTTAEAITLLKQAQAIRSILTGIKTSSDKARANLDAMIASLQEKLDRIDSLVAEADVTD